jgi:hypothetical protein
MGFEDDASSNGSAPSEIAPPAGSFAPLRFDAARYMQFVKDEELTEDQAGALLRACWEIFVTQVDIAWGIHPIQQVVDRLPEQVTSLPSASARVVFSRLSHPTNPNDETAARDVSVQAAEEDS